MDEIMIQYTQGNIFDIDVDAIINPVNCIGVMGRGLALQFKNRYPGNFQNYVKACNHGVVTPGVMFTYERKDVDFETNQFVNPRYIINFPTKRHWREPSYIEDIEAGLYALVEEIKRLNISSIAIPALGAGLGGLPWSLVRSRMDAILSNLDDVTILIFEPL